MSTWPLLIFRSVGQRSVLKVKPILYMLGKGGISVLQTAIFIFNWVLYKYSFIFLATPPQASAPGITTPMPATTMAVTTPGKYCYIISHTPSGLRPRNNHTNASHNCYIISHTPYILVTPPQASTPDITRTMPATTMAVTFPGRYINNVVNIFGRIASNSSLWNNVLRPSNVNILVNLCFKVLK